MGQEVLRFIECGILVETQIVPHLPCVKTTAHVTLHSVWKLYREVWPSLSMDRQLCWKTQLEIIYYVGYYLKYLVYLFSCFKSKRHHLFKQWIWLCICIIKRIYIIYHRHYLNCTFSVVCFNIKSIALIYNFDESNNKWTIERLIFIIKCEYIQSQISHQKLS